MSKSYEFAEYDETGKLVATYRETKFRSGKTNRRFDRIVPKIRKTRQQQLLNVFLPTGYPKSVTEDYVRYQIYDSLQAFFSSIAGLIASRAVLQGAGVGDAKASPTAALLLSTMQDSMGRIATIVFAHRLGKALEPECKMYRLLADILNDAAMILDCLSPNARLPIRVILLSGSSILRALCGVAANSSKASLSAHFARSGNLGELNAKDSSQETVISLLGMIVGSVVVSHVTTIFATWTTLLCLLVSHLATNYGAVKSVCMANVNRQRCNIIFSTLLNSQRVLTPQEVCEREHVFEWDGALRWSNGTGLGYCSLGVSLHTIKKNMAGHDSGKGGINYHSEDWDNLLRVFELDDYLMWINPLTHQALVALMQDAQPHIHLQAWVHALLACQVMFFSNKVQEEKDVVAIIAKTKQQTANLLTKYGQEIKDAGWDLEAGVVLETRPGLRFRRNTMSTSTQR